ncbi:MAG: periplasmic heavy metal sensor [Saprospiraceae bacterium]|nr:periplasmic heavy metal sensor [Saprospiraceae bacterium]
MNRSRFLMIMVVALVLLNIGTLAFFRWGKMPPPPRPQQFRNTIVEKLHFDTPQATAYDQLITNHRSKISATEAEIKSAKEQLYSLLSTEQYATKDSLISRIGALHQEIEQIHFEHFQAIKGLCKGDQIQLFNQLTGELAHFFSPQRPAPGRPEGPGR